MIRIEIALDEHAPRIKKLVLASGVHSIEDLAFNKVFPFWLVAWRGTRIVGAIQTCPGLPIGRLELLAVDRSLPHRFRAQATKALLMQGLSVLLQHGCEAASGMIPFEAKAYKRLLKKRGAVVILSGNTMMFRLQSGDDDGWVDEFDDAGDGASSDRDREGLAGTPA